MVDLKEIAELLRTKGKVRGNPVGISLFRDEIPQGYEPIQEPPCAIVRLAMDDGLKVYFDAEHHDCLVGMHHAGIIPGKKEIVSGEYLSKTSGFFSYDGAARLKAGMVHCNGAAMSLDEPFGGYKQSGNGREWGRYGFEAFLETKVVLGCAAG